jgi:hypothetical protein
MAMFTQSMTDLDEFRAVIRPVGSEVIIAGGGKFAAIINRVDLNGLWMQRAQENVPRLMNGWVDRRRASCVFVTHPEHGMVWNGLEALYGGMIMAPPGGDFCQRLPGPTQWGSMSLPVEDLVEIGATLVGQDLTPQRNPRRIIPAPAAIGRLLRIHRAAAELIKNAPEVIANQLARQGLEQAVAQALIRCIVTRDLQNDAVHQYRHHAILRGFRATLEKWGEQAVYISDVCEAIGVPARTLRICCQEYLE